MNEFMEVLVGFRKKFAKSVVNYTDPGYYILRQKITPLSKEENEFTEVYETNLCLHIISIAATIPGCVYYVSYYKAYRKQDVKTAGWARRRLLFYFPIAMATGLVGYIFEKTNRFHERLREIEQFYLDRRDQDINTISFTVSDAQTL